MDTGRRSFLAALAPTAFALTASRALLADLGRAQGRPPLPPEPESEPPKPDTRALLKLNQKNIKKDVQRLFELAEELKKEVEKTDSADVLSLQMVRKAEEIEKLARHIKDLARG